MSSENPDDLERIDQQIRINELKHEAEELSGGEMSSFEADDLPPDIAEQFWDQVVAFEKAPRTTHIRRLQEAGVEMPPVEELPDREVSARLWEVIHALAEQGVFLLSTNHLSDRELYRKLLDDVLLDTVPDISGDEFGACVIDLVSSGSPEDIRLYLKHYADEEARSHWAESFPGEKIPAHEDPAYDRDRLLPGDSSFGEP